MSDNVISFRKKADEAKAQTETDTLLTVINKRLFQKISTAVEELRSELIAENIALDDIMGSGIIDYVAASITLLNSCHFFNKLVGHEIKAPFNLKLEFKEVEQLAISSMQRLLRVEQDRFQRHLAEELVKEPLFRRLKKKSKDNLEYFKNKIKEIESKD